MYQVEVESPLFVGQTMVKQHRMVNEVRQCLFSVKPLSDAIDLLPSKALTHVL
jgi:hypothetical protein